MYKLTNDTLALKPGCLQERYTQIANCNICDYRSHKTTMNVSNYEDNIDSHGTIYTELDRDVEINEKQGIAEDIDNHGNLIGEGDDDG
ncbi:hypothetical protein PoB_005177200 [Plakobranchus ocellatus]|uniref:Uncharacterized protein n=1 Tax=Plakobranchus ocellatus TaxID=259542 RepID=A0AAV4C1P3_9GAST|nr:hypothetical protein PoB_005177200 [Plakobranchus ocellatus]